MPQGIVMLIHMIQLRDLLLKASFFLQSSLGSLALIHSNYLFMHVSGSHARACL